MVADSRVKQLAAGEIVEFQALGRLHVPAILGNAGSATKDVEDPIEFVLLDME